MMSLDQQYFAKMHPLLWRIHPDKDSSRRWYKNQEHCLEEHARAAWLCR